MNQSKFNYIVVLLVGCGGKAETPGSPVIQDAASLAACPSGPSGACGAEGVTCEYGDDPVPECNALFKCTGGALQAETHSSATCPTVDAGVSAACPAYPPPAASDEGGAICQVGLICDYPEGRCQCARAFPTEDVGFACVVPADGCPTTRPRLGTTCSQAGQGCSYEACGVSSDFGVIQCTNGIWVRDTEGFTCPT